MAITFVKKSVIPVARLGKEATNSVTITEAGQIVLSTIASKFFEGSNHVAMAFDGTKCYIFREDSPMVANQIKKGEITPADLYELKHPKDPKKSGKTLFFSAGGMLSRAKQFNASADYDYKNNGNQQFQVVDNEKVKNAKAIQFLLPESGKLAARPKQARKRKEKPAPGTAANPGEIAGKPVAVPNQTTPPPTVTAEEENLVLEESA